MSHGGPSPHYRRSQNPPRGPNITIRDTQADDTLSYSGVGPLRNVGLHLGRILNSSEVPDTQMRFISALVPVLCIVDHQDGMRYGATMPTCGPIQILSPC